MKLPDPRTLRIETPRLILRPPPRSLAWRGFMTMCGCGRNYPTAARVIG